MYQDILDELMGQIQQVKDGQLSALDLYPKLNEFSKSVGSLRKDLQDEVIEEASHYDKREEIIKGGYKISIVESKKYKYDHNPAYVMIDQKRKNLQALMKKAASTTGEFFDESTGEMIPPAEVKGYTYPKCEFVGNTIEV